MKQMIDWYFVLMHGLWILGLSVVLAACSFHVWLRRELNRTFLQEIRAPSFRLASSAGLLLVALGLVLLGGSRWWERPLWFLLGCLSGWSAWTAGRAMNAARGR